MEDYKGLKEADAVVDIAKATEISPQGADSHLVVTYKQFDSFTGEPLEDKTTSYSKSQVDQQIETVTKTLESLQAIRAEFDKNHKVYEPVSVMDAAEE